MPGLRRGEVAALAGVSIEYYTGMERGRSSDGFRRRWSAHDVRIHGAGVKHFHHPVVGDLTLASWTAELQAERGLDMCIYTAEPGSPAQQALALLASWPASRDSDSTDQRSSTSR